MIGSLRGTLVERSTAGEVVVEVGGVGYVVFVPPATVAALGEPGATVLLHTHLAVREDALTLYGFGTRDERACFEALIGAHGVGPALALAVLSVHRPDVLRRAVADDDVGALCLVPGVGRKTAARLLIELKDRLGVLAAADVLAPAAAGDRANGSSPPARAEVRAALAALGYGPDEIAQSLRDLPESDDVPRSLKAALSRLAPVR
ncbi:MAG TPA: Holliday junction branch migration protein RuvA [Acidimicrobiales bacterium]|nr:Holliday junction branch migration protein RuvA [Acidimicrobiales bacterium]